MTVIEGDVAAGSSVRSVKKEAIARIQDRLSKAPAEGDRNIIIVNDADTITTAGYNRLLKTLEEPAPGSVIMLLSENINDLELTVRSRCVHLRLDAGKAKRAKGISEKAQALTDGLCSGARFFELRPYIESVGRDREKAYALIDTMEELYDEKLKGNVSRAEREKIYVAFEALEDARARVKNKDMVPYALKNMILEIIG